MISHLKIFFQGGVEKVGVNMTKIRKHRKIKRKIEMEI